VRYFAYTSEYQADSSLWFLIAGSIAFNSWFQWWTLPDTSLKALIAAILSEARLPAASRIAAKAVVALLTTLAPLICRVSGLLRPHRRDPTRVLDRSHLSDRERPPPRRAGAAEVPNFASPVGACHRLVPFLPGPAVIRMMDEPMGRATWRPRSRGAAF